MFTFATCGCKGTRGSTTGLAEGKSAAAAVWEQLLEERDGGPQWDAQRCSLFDNPRRRGAVASRRTPFCRHDIGLHGGAPFEHAALPGAGGSLDCGQACLVGSAARGDGGAVRRAASGEGYEVRGRRGLELPWHGGKVEHTRATCHRDPRCGLGGIGDDYEGKHQ